MRGQIAVLLCIFSLFCTAIAMERNVAIEQRAVRAISVKVSSVGVKSGLDKYRVTSTQTATGTYDVTYTKPFSRDATAYVTPVAATCGVKSITETLKKVTVVMAAADLSTEKNCAFNLVVFGSDTTEAY